MDRIEEIRERAKKFSWSSEPDYIDKHIYIDDAEYLISELDRLTDLLAKQQTDMDATDSADRELHAAWEEQKRELDRLNHIVEANKKGDEPLTIEELKQMIGRPIYVVCHTLPSDSGWTFIDNFDDVENDNSEFVEAIICNGVVDECGVHDDTMELVCGEIHATWDAYRHNPEGKEGGQQNDKQRND